MMKITAVRHGETTENFERIVQGQTFGTLSETGERQIAELGEKLKNEVYDIVYSSDLERCKRTAAAIMQYHPDVKLVFDARLRERSLKPLEGIPFDDLGWNHDEIHSLDVKTDKGESWNDVRARIEPFIAEVKSQPEQKVLLVTHGGPMRILEAVLGELPLDETIKMFHENCATRTWEV
jgi:broad specificity phosphatase PhoE